MTEKTRKAGRTMSPRSKLFKSEVADLRPFLPSNYTEIALRIFPALDPKKLRYAVVGRAEYWDGMPVLRILAGKAPMPDGIVLTPPVAITA